MTHHYRSSRGARRRNGGRHQSGDRSVRTTIKASLRAPRHRAPRHLCRRWSRLRPSITSTTSSRSESGADDPRPRRPRCMAAFPIQSATLPDSLSDTTCSGGVGRAAARPSHSPTHRRPLAASSRRRSPADRDALGPRPHSRAGQSGHDLVEPLARSDVAARATVYGGVGHGTQVSACVTASTSSSRARPPRRPDRNAALPSRCGRDHRARRSDHMADLGFLPGEAHSRCDPQSAANVCCSRPRSTRRSTASSASTWSIRGAFGGHEVSSITR